MIPYVVAFGCLAFHLYFEFFYEPLPRVAQAATRGGITLMVIGAIGLAFGGQGFILFMATGGIMWSSAIAIVVIRLLLDRTGNEGETR